MYAEVADSADGSPELCLGTCLGHKLWLITSAEQNNLGKKLKLNNMPR